MEISDLKAKIFTLLREDEEFRYAVAGMLGLDEILRRLEKHDERFEEILRRLDKHEEELIKLREDMNKMREDMIAGFKRHDEEIAKLREDMIQGFKRHDEEIAKLRADMIAGFKRHDEEIAKLREDMIQGFKRHDEEMVKLRSDMIEGFNLLRRHIDAIGARWGILSEKAFREGLRGIVERELGLRIEKWIRWDGEGYVFGHPSAIDVDVSISDEKINLIEIKSRIGRADVYTFKRKAELYERIEGKKPTKLIIVTPYAEEDALETARQLQIEIYTGI